MRAEVSAAQASERRFRVLFDATYRPVVAFVTRRLRNQECIDDVVSNTFLVAWRRLEEMPQEVDEAQLWLYRVAHFGVLNARRAARRRDALYSRLGRERAAGDDPSRSVQLPGDEPSSLTDAFHSLSEGDRALLLLAAWEGLEPDQLAIVLGSTKDAATQRLSRARRRFELAVERGEPEAAVVREVS